ncbi:non-canonical purine NTP pyrophosphatase [Mammaliicoccus lentus]|mgnify:CR=1 FL=1|uniref:dITP/XTP pyrophosphatase n=1 Tax=Mammaliicoccus lentus TaxID=42858 RepID=A0AAX3W7L6_MAMLE|nr:MULTISPECIES: XTP/dITP diphosphatase [Mammaliicoccus]HBV04302.1 XTP/dITP diphosphatase [Staphylococcus sp.]HIS18611.1 XTP/dITP diphosphatase [Candidatus Coprovivens excrementavium]MBF0749759.1 XTP/dITP diphosphatase [Mammaliicoccus lentus]MBF0793758.1 XTP/dITP diphosphatase [Mammaliicoccus lentus]MBW0770465.1 XTP/dITP diphosphatase [Mammaliicoccus lentus]
MKDIIIASNNKGKIEDFKAIFPKANVIGISEIAPDFDVEETGTTFEENAILKSETASKALNKIVIADDSGLSVEALYGEPGIYSARYAGEPKDDQANIEKLLSNLKDKENKNAEFICAIAVSEPGKDTVTYVGKVQGEIIDEQRGENGFGYDPIFFVPSLDKTMAELTAAEKSAISHRGNAIKLMNEDIGERFQ